MDNLISSKIDHKNIGLVKTLYQLRQDLDVYCLIAVNAGRMHQKNIGKCFFGYVQQLSIISIALGICKIFENETRNELNSISGVLRHIINTASSKLNHKKLDEFIQKYDGSSNNNDTISALSSTVTGFVKKYNKELEAFKTFRDKKVAHSEYRFETDSLPSFDVMEKLFNFGLDFYSLVSENLVRVVPCNLNAKRNVKFDLKGILEKLGLEEIKMEMK
ncbi:hydrogenase maturation factor [Candidatus Scalindua japonica]|uniref:Hydrogenase maturation factor n=1 Tax=Candidatus Scalindua japonica TaxID=1284222 RepID=A0A286TYI4_9BACT|nr:hypothetical protein [Candidatus Scalindua japonica]GAX60926.1 hydrogenase maturation factor [Candidatus Scalindua japonica]